MFPLRHYLSVELRLGARALDAWGTIAALGATTVKLRLDDGLAGDLSPPRRPQPRR